MIFLPVPLFSTVILCGLLARFLMQRDMTIRAHQLFGLLVGLYIVQSVLVSLRWGYGFEKLSFLIALLAPTFPVLAFMAYGALAGRLTGRRLWPIGIIALNWILFATLPDLADLTILITFMGFGGLLLQRAQKGPDKLLLTPINDTREIVLAMRITGATLVASGFTDAYLIYDFVQNAGQNTALIVTLAQTAFALVIGYAAVFARSISNASFEMVTPPNDQAPTEQNGEVAERIESLLRVEKLHQSEDLTLRRLSRRLGLPDRHVSNAINRIYGMNVSQFINERRVHDACSLLQETERTVLDVAFSVGFATKSNFNREFLRVTGQTPSAWRNKTGSPKNRYPA